MAHLYSDNKPRYSLYLSEADFILAVHEFPETPVSAHSDVLREAWDRTLALLMEIQERPVNCWQG